MVKRIKLYKCIDDNNVCELIDFKYEEINNKYISSYTIHEKIDIHNVLNRVVCGNQVNYYEIVLNIEEIGNNLIIMEENIKDIDMHFFPIMHTYDNSYNSTIKKYVYIENSKKYEYVNRQDIYNDEIYTYSYFEIMDKKDLEWLVYLLNISDTTL